MWSSEVRASEMRQHRAVAVPPAQNAGAVEARQTQRHSESSSLPEQLRYRATVVDAADGAGEEFGNGEDGHVGEAFAFWLRNAVSDDNLRDLGIAEALKGRAGKDAVRDTAVDIARASLLDDAHGLRDGACRVDLLVDDQGVTALDAADNILGLRLPVIAQAALLDDGKRGVEPVGQFARLLGKALIGRDDGEVAQFHLGEIPCLQDLRGQFIDGNVEKTLNLPGVHVHRQHAVRARDGDAVGDQPRGDGNARLILLVGAPIGIVGDDGGDAIGGGTFERIDHNEQFHNRAIDGRAERLNDKDILAAHILIDFDKNILITELKYVGIARWNAKMATDCNGQLRICISRKDTEIVHEYLLTIEYIISLLPGAKLAPGTYL